MDQWFHRAARGARGPHRDSPRRGLELAHKARPLAVRRRVHLPRPLVHQHCASLWVGRLLEHPLLLARHGARRRHADSPSATSTPKAPKYLTQTCLRTGWRHTPRRPVHLSRCSCAPHAPKPPVRLPPMRLARCRAAAPDNVPTALPACGGASPRSIDHVVGCEHGCSTRRVVPARPEVCDFRRRWDVESTGELCRAGVAHGRASPGAGTILLRFNAPRTHVLGAKPQLSPADSVNPFATVIQRKRQGAGHAMQSPRCAWMCRSQTCGCGSSSVPVSRRCTTGAAIGRRWVTQPVVVRPWRCVQ